MDLPRRANRCRFGCRLNRRRMRQSNRSQDDRRLHRCIQSRMCSTMPRKRMFTPGLADLFEPLECYQRRHSFGKDSAE